MSGENLKNNAQKAPGWAIAIVIVLLLGAIFMLTSDVYAFSTNTFNNSLSSENILFFNNLSNTAIINSIGYYNFTSKSVDYVWPGGKGDIFQSDCSFGCNYVYFSDTAGVAGMWTTALSNPNCIQANIDYGYSIADTAFAINQYLCALNPQNRIAVMKVLSNSSSVGKYSWNWYDSSGYKYDRYISIPTSVSYITNAYLNLSLVNDSVVYRNTSISSQVCSSGVFTCQYARDGNMLTSALVGATLTQNGSIYQNWSIEMTNLNNLTFNLRYRLLGFGFINVSCLNSSLDEQYIFSDTGTGDYSADFESASYEVPSSCRRADDILMINATLRAGGAGANSSLFTEANVSADYSKSNNMYVYINNDWVANKTGVGAFRTNNFASLINDYMVSQYIIGSNYVIPLSLTADIPANVDYSSIQIDNLGFTENSQTYNNPVYETSTQTFSIDVTYDSSFYTLSSARLIYNGTSYLATKSGSGNNIMFTRSITIPSVSVASSKSFYWEISLTNGTTTNTYNSTTQTQTVNPLTISSCVGGAGSNLTLNFTAYDEQNTNRINPFIFQGTFNIWLGDGSVYKNLTINNLTASEIDLCLNVDNQTVYTNSNIQYTDAASLYVSRNYYLVNASLTNTTQAINLYLLNRSAPASSFILNVLDSNNLPDPDVYIYTLRYYPGENLYRTVQIARTDNAGQSIGFFQQEIPDYKFILVKDGSVVLSTDNRKVVAQVTPYTITFNLGNTIATPWASFQNISNLQYSLTWNKTSKIVSYAYIDTSGLIHYARLYVYQTNYTGANPTICDVNSTDSAATLVCNMTGYSGSFEAKATISRSPEAIVDFIVFALEDLASTFGNLGTFVGWLIIIVCAFAFIYNPSLGIVGINVAVIFDQMLGLINFGWVFVFGLMGISILLWAELNT